MENTKLVMKIRKIVIQSSWQVHVLHMETYQGHGHERLEIMKYRGIEKGGHDHEGPKTMQYYANEVHTQGKHRGHEQTEPGDRFRT